MNTPANKVQFPGASRALLAARLDLPAAAPRALVMFVHCFTCSKDMLAATHIAAGLVAPGFGVLRFDFTGLGGAVVLADEQAEQGGTDTGPSPYDLLLAALGACTSMTLRLYADQKRWPLERVVVKLAHDRFHASDCAECKTRDGKVDRIEREVKLNGPLDSAQRQRLLEIADRCPVRRTPHSEVVIRTRLAHSPPRS